MISKNKIKNILKGCNANSYSVYFKSNSSDWKKEGEYTNKKDIINLIYKEQKEKQNIRIQLNGYSNEKKRYTICFIFKMKISYMKNYSIELVEEWLEGADKKKNHIYLDYNSK